MYTLTIPLNVSYSYNRNLGKLFKTKQKIKNILINRCNKCLKGLENNISYQNLLTQYRNTKNKKLKSKIGKQLNEIILRYGLTEFNLIEFAKPLRQKYKNKLTSHEIDCIVADVYNGIQNVIYSKGKNLHIKSLYDIHSISAKNLTNGLKFDKDNLIVYQGNSKHKIPLPLKINPKNLYIQECLLEDINKIKFCRIIRRQFPNYYHYYIQFCIDSSPPNKLKIKDGTSGIDIGTQTIAIANDNKCILTELAIKTNEYNKQIRKLQRKLDKSRQETNKELYNKDGTVKKGSKGKFKKSKNYIKLQRQLRTIYRKKSEYIRQEHNKLVNEIIQISKQGIYIEPMNYQSLSRKSKSKTQKSNKVKTIKGKKVQICKKKRRFGKSINNKSPGLFINILKYKCQFNQIPYYEIDRTSFKASQYNHLTDTYTKKDLSQRWNILGIDKIQRDLYSAFLIKNSNSDLTKADREKCNAEYPQFKKLHNKEIKRLQNSSIKKLQSLGI